MKRHLRAVLQTSFGSVNSDAHITVIKFFALENDLPIIAKELQSVIECLSPFTLQFNNYGDFPPSRSKSNGTFFVKPENDSGIEILNRGKMIDRNFKQLLKRRYTQEWSIECRTPHMTIGRDLTWPFIQLAYAHFLDFSAQFLCNAITLRKFNEVKRQYEVIHSFPLVDKQNPKSEQLSLF